MYASPQADLRAALWQYMSQLGCVVNIGWMVVGDVNQPLDSIDKRGGQPVNQNLANQLRSTIEACHLMDMGFQGARFTWTNGRTGTANIRERIDRAWCNVHFYQHFNGTVVWHLLCMALNHHPLLIRDPQLTTQTTFTGFRFLEAWFRHPEFDQKVEEFWKPEPQNLSQTFSQFKTHIWQWNKDSFDNIFWLKKRCQVRLTGVQESLAHHFRPSLLKLERKLLRELTEILL